MILPPSIKQDYTLDDLVTVFDTVEKKVLEATTPQDLIEAVDRLDRFNKRTGKLAFNENMVKLLSIFLFLAGAALQVVDLIFRGDINPFYFLVLGIGLFFMTEGLEMVRRYTVRAINLLELNAQNVSPETLKQAEDLTRDMMSGLKITMEAYPDLKASDLAANLMREISEQQANVTAAISIYNRNAEVFNNGIQMFPHSFVNNSFNKEVPLESFQNVEAEDALEWKPKLY